MKKFMNPTHLRRAKLFIRILFACLFVAALSVATLPARADDAEAAQKAFDNWKAALENVQKKKDAVKAAEGQLAQARAKMKDDKELTASEKQLLENLENNVAKANADLKAAEAELMAAFNALEEALRKLPDDSELKKELRRKRGILLDQAKTANLSPQTQQIAQAQTAGGLLVTTFNTANGRIILNLPDDMRAGDTISGTVVTEPKGTTPEEKTKNQEKLNNYFLDLEGTKVPTSGPRFTWAPTTPLSFPVNYRVRIFEVLPDQTANARMIAETLITPSAIRLPLDNLATITPVTTSSGEVVSQFRMPDSTIFSIDVSTAKVKPQFHMGQQGRPVEIFGPFDGNSSNTILRYGPTNSTVQDFEKNTENVSGGFGLIRPLAESPRKMVFESPPNFDGPVQLMLKEGDTTALAPYRSVGVRLSAPKTNLMRGERTTLTIEVRGLEGIKKDVPLQLDSKGVITMEGGNFQNLRIKPQEVTPEGRYITTRAITGQQAGAFTVTATVIVRRFDFSLQDDTDPNRLFHFNSFTGDYIFACGGGSCRGSSPTGGTSGQPPGSSVPTTPVNLTGTGKMQMKGCIITLSHNAPDRRVFARLDACTKSGEANVQTSSPKAEINITDKNTADNTAASLPPK
jgi:hypothetical protein